MTRHAKISHPWARYRRNMGLTQSSVADRVGVTRHYIIRLEQSLFWHPSDSLLVRLSILYDIELGEFEESYYRYVRDTREEFARTHSSFEALFGSGLRSLVWDKHPLVIYRERHGLSRMGLCKGLCLHYDPVSEYEANKQRDIPAQLVEACDDIKWDYQPLVSAVAEWRISGRADRKSA